MQLSGKGTGVMSILTSHLKLQDAEVSTNGQFEERKYKKFGLTIRRRRLLPDLPPPIPEDGSEPPMLPQEPQASALNNLALSIEAEHSIESEHTAPAPAVAFDVRPAQVSAEEGLAALSASLEPCFSEPAGDPPANTASQQYPILSGKTLGVVGFSPQDAAAIGQALAAQYCSFSFLTHADAEFRKGATNGCDLLILSTPHEWSVPGSLNPATLLKTKKPLLMVGTREDLSSLAMRSQGGGLRELVPAPWHVSDMIWRAATLLGRIQEPRGRNGKKSLRKRIIIGDESPARALVHAVLAQEGMECHVADNGVDTVALARAKQADAVIIDVSLPGLDGFQVLAEIRRD